MTDDNSIFANIILKTLHNVHQSPALFTANIQEVQNRCHSHLVLAKKLDKLPSLLVQIPRWAADRILCLIYKTTDNEFHRFLKVSGGYNVTFSILHGFGLNFRMSADN